MKTIIKTLLIITIFTFFSCNEDENEPSPVNKFTVEGVDYLTPNCYIEFDDEDNQDEFNLFFLQGTMADNDGGMGDYAFSLTTFNWVFYNIRDDENPSITTPYPNIQTGVSYIGGPTDTVIIANGTPGDDDSGTDFSNGGTPTLTINSWNFDSTTQTGTINVDYVWGNVTGHYEGALGVIFD